MIESVHSYGYIYIFTYIFNLNCHFFSPYGRENERHAYKIRAGIDSCYLTFSAMIGRTCHMIEKEE